MNGNPLLGENPPGATPLDADELDGLIPAHITTRDELNAWEQENILQAIGRLRARRPKEVLDDAFLRKLHGLMFGDTWRWAGTYRKRETNIGIEPAQIAVQVRLLCETFRVQRDTGQCSPQELAIRFHRDLVWIHPFPNGNGRHTRLAADLLLESLGEDPFTWGGSDDRGSDHRGIDHRGTIDAAGRLRDEYLAALRAADKGDNQPLLEFARR